jgi:hypothetical protein
MQNDILPPRRSKTHTNKKVGRLAANPQIIDDKLSIDLSDIKPLESTKPAEAAAKKVSLKNIRGNLHPKHWYNLTREEQVVLLGGLSAVFLVLVFASYTLFFKSTAAPSITIQKKVVAAPKVTTVPAPLTGLPIDPALAARPVTGIMIENSLDARPQSGLQEAGVVYEAIAEGGITRFMALYQDTRPAYVGPVRSLRPYYLDFAVPFDAGIAHVGGSPEALEQVRAGMKDLDQFFNSGAYWRQNTRVAPHNVYTSFERLDALNQAKGYTASTLKPWPRQAAKPLAVPSAKSIDIKISSFYYNSHYEYDAKTNSYLRSEGDKPHLVTATSDDIGSAVQLQPKVVIALVMSYGIQADGKHSEYGVTGSGPVYVFQGGGVIQGTWDKADRASQFVFKDSAGKEIKLEPGQTWLSAVSSAGMVSYSP